MNQKMQVDVCNETNGAMGDENHVNAQNAEENDLNDFEMLDVSDNGNDDNIFDGFIAGKLGVCCCFVFSFIFNYICSNFFIFKSLHDSDDEYDDHPYSPISDNSGEEYEQNPHNIISQIGIIGTNQMVQVDVHNETNDELGTVCGLQLGNEVVTAINRSHSNGQNAENDGLNSVEMLDLSGNGKNDNNSDGLDGFISGSLGYFCLK